MNLQTASIVRSQRIRLFFDTNIDTAGFTTPYYRVVSTDAAANQITLRAVYGVSGNPKACELVLGEGLLPSTTYNIYAEGVPATDTTTSAAGTHYTLRYDASIKQQNIEPVLDERDLVLFGRDIIWNGHDFQETPEGDLAILAGLTNAKAAAERRYLGSPLPYAPEYSPNSREFVDAVDISALPGRIRAQARRDARIKAVSVETIQNADGSITLQINTTFIGDRQSEPVSVTFPR